MSHTPEQSAIAVSLELENTLKAASFEEIKEHLKNAAIAQGLAHREWDETIITPNEPGTVPRAYGRTITVNGKSTIITGDSELALERAVGEFYRETFAGQPAVTESTEPERDSAGRFVAAKTPEEQAAEDARRLSLEAEFRLGHLSTSQFLEQSGLLQEEIEKTMGVPVETLREVVQEKEGEKFTQSWERATTVFLNSSVGSSWPGGRENYSKISSVCEQLGLIDAEDKVAALAQAYQYMVENDLLVANPKTELEDKISSARSSSEVVAALDEAMGLPAARHQLRGW